MKAITKFKLHLKLLNSFSMELIVKKHHVTYYFTFQPPKLSNWTQNKNKKRDYITIRLLVQISQNLKDRK